MNARNFADYYAGLRTNDEGNKNSSSFHAAMDSDESTIEDRIKTLTQDPDDVVACADSEGKVNLIHSMKNLGGRLRRPEDKILALVGMDSEAVVVEVVKSSLAKGCNFKAPKLSDYKKCDTREQLKKLKANSGPSTVSSAFILAPFLFEAMISADSNDPLELIPEAIKVAEEFDKATGLDAEIDPAMKHAEEFADWCWGAAMGEVDETKFLVRPMDPDAKEYSKKRHEECIRPSSSVSFAAGTRSEDGDDVLRQLVAGISRQNENSAQHNQLLKADFERRAAKEEEKKDRFKNCTIQSPISS